MVNFFKTIKSFRYAFKGIFWLSKYENNFRFHLLATLVAIGFSFYLEISKMEWLWILFSITLVWTMEAINTAIEKLVDLVSPNYHPAAGIIKDVAAAGVLFTAIFSALAGCIIFLPYIADKFF